MKTKKNETVWNWRAFGYENQKKNETGEHLDMKTKIETGDHLNMKTKKINWRAFGYEN